MKTLGFLDGEKQKRRIIYTFVVVLLWGGMLACGGRDEMMCTADLTHEGQTFTGISETFEQADLNACNFYCLENDPDTEAMYQIWLGSDQAESTGPLSKKEAMFENDALLDQVTLVCSPACVADAFAGQMELTTTCKQ